MSIARKVAGNTLIQLVGKILTTGISLLIVGLVTRTLGLSGYGDYIAIFAYSQFFAIFADLGTNIYIVKRLSENKDKDKNSSQEAGAMLSLRLLTGLTVVIAAVVILMYMPYSTLVKQGILIMLWGIFLQNLNSLFISVLQAKLEIKFAVIGELIGRISMLLFALMFLFFGKGLLGIIVATTIGNAINMLITYWYANKFVPFKLVWNTALWKTIIKHSLPISVTAILSFIYFKIDTVLLSVLPIPGKINSIEVGIYGSAYKILELLLLIPVIFLGNLFPVLSNYISHEKERAVSLLQKSFNVMSLFSFPVTVLVFVLAPNILHFVAGNGFESAAVPLRILSFAVLLTYFNGLFTYTALALNRQKDLIWVYALAAVFNISANILFIPHYSYMAASYTTLATEILVLLGAWLVCKNHIRLNFSFAKPLKCLGISLLLAAFLMFFQGLHILIGLMAGIIFYGSGILLFKIYSLSEIKSLLSKAS